MPDNKIVAECWTCSYLADFWDVPEQYRCQEGKGRQARPLDLSQPGSNYHRQHGHDVRPVNRDRA